MNAIGQDKAMQQLELLVGEWECVETYHAGGWTEQEVVSTEAKDIIKYGIGNSYITADYTSKSAMGTYFAYDLIYWDEGKGRYIFSYFDSWGNKQIQEGEWKDEKTLVFSHTMEMNGQAGEFQRIYSFPSEGKQHLDVQFVIEDGAKQLLVSIEKTKRAGSL
ncbi:MAG: DUF1579 family protein [Bacteroidota bacterium]